MVQKSPCQIGSIKERKRLDFKRTDLNWSIIQFSHFLLGCTDGQKCVKEGGRPDESWTDWRNSMRKRAHFFNLKRYYIDDLIVFKNKSFKEYIKHIHPRQFIKISETTESETVAINKAS